MFGAPGKAFAIPVTRMPISQEEVTKIASLSNLALTPEETASFSVQLAAIVEYIDQLSEVDISHVQPWQHRSAGEAASSYAAREDFVEPSLGTVIALANAPDPDAGHFAVPKVIGG